MPAGSWSGPRAAMATRAEPAAADRGPGPSDPWIGLLRRAGRGLQRVPRSRAWVPAVLWMTLIWLVSSAGFPGPGRPSPFGWFTNLGHAPLFGLLGLWLALSLPRAGGWPRLGRREVGLVLGLVAAYALVDELHQGFVAGRDPSVFDVATDLVGAACTLWIAGFVPRETARDAGLGLRVLASLALCALAASLATWMPLAFPEHGWM